MLPIHNLLASCTKSTKYVVVTQWQTETIDNKLPFSRRQSTSASPAPLNEYMNTTVPYKAGVIIVIIIIM